MFKFHSEKRTFVGFSTQPERTLSNREGQTEDLRTASVKLEQRCWIQRRGPASGGVGDGPTEELIPGPNKI